MAKPGDFFVGIVDFFAVLLPGALLAFVLESWVQTQNFSIPLVKIPQGTEWVVFAFASYVLGHIIFGLGSLLDYIYDHTYCRYKRREVSEKSDWEKKQKKKMGLFYAVKEFCKKYWSYSLGESYAKAKGFQKFGKHLRSLFASTQEPDPLLELVHEVKQKEVWQIVLKNKQQPSVDIDISSDFTWATARVRLQNPVAASEIDHIEADSKFFRGFVIALVIIGGYIFFAISDQPRHWLLPLGCFVLVLISLWRYMQLRWKRTEVTYLYFIALNTPQLSVNVQ